jgi:hypothetical protein
MINIQNVKHLATALLGSVSISAHALSGTMEFTGAFGLNDNTYDVTFDYWDGFVISPIGSFSGDLPDPGTTGTVKNVSLANPGVRDVPGFLTFTAAPHLRFDLTDVEPGIFNASACFASASVAQTCTPPDTALNLTNLPHGSTMSFSMEGQIVDTRNGSSTPYAGYFSAIFPFQYQFFLNDNGGTGWTYSAVFQETGPTVIPEPATWAMLLGGLACLGLVSVCGRGFPRTAG